MAAVNPEEVAGAGAKGASTIMLWSHPRSMSTALERAFMQREADFRCVHEPFWEPFFCGPQRRAGHQHPWPVFLRRRTTFPAVTRKLQSMAARAFPAGRRLFVKDMAYFVVLSESELGLLSPPPAQPMNPTVLPEQVLRGMTHTFLIRTPAKAVPSLYRRMALMPTLGGPQVPILPCDVGLREQRVLFDYVTELGGGATPVVMDAEDVLQDPEGMMRAYCAALGVEFRKAMLEWDVAKDKSMFLHATGPLARLFHRFTVRDFYRDVENSTGFGLIQPRCRQKQAQEQAALASLPEQVQDLIQDNMRHYNYLRQFRINPAVRILPAVS